MIYGYARVSTAGQKSDGNGLEAQMSELKAKGCVDILTEQYSGSTTHRPVLEQIFGRLEQGDTLMVAKLDRLARNTMEGIDLIQKLFAKGVAVHVLNVGLLENTPMGQFFITTLLAVAQLEREMIRERTEAGKAIAKQRPGYREGRKRIEIPDFEKFREKQKEGMTVAEICRMLGVSRTTWYDRMRCA